MIDPADEVLEPNVAETSTASDSVRTSTEIAMTAKVVDPRGYVTEAPVESAANSAAEVEALILAWALLVENAAESLVLKDDAVHPTSAVADRLGERWTRNHLALSAAAAADAPSRSPLILKRVLTTPPATPKKK